MFSNYSINETTFVKEALEKRIRIDGRELQQFRKLDISYGNKGGQNITRLGNTAVYSEIESTISTPNSDKPKEGSIRFNVDISYMYMASDLYKQSEYIMDARTQISRLIEQTLIYSRAVDKESLCIVQGKYCWNIKVNSTLLSYDGNIIDCIMISVIAAFKSLKLPTAIVKEGKLELDYHTPYLIPVHHIPLCISCYEMEGIGVLMDATAMEESISAGAMVICINIYNDICGIHTIGKCQFNAAKLRQYIDIAKSLVKPLVNAIRESLDNPKCIIAK